MTQIINHRKQLSKEQRYREKLISLGFKRKNLWVYDDDFPQLKRLADKLFKARMAIIEHDQANS